MDGKESDGVTAAQRLSAVDAIHWPNSNLFWRLESTVFGKRMDESLRAKQLFSCIFISLRYSFELHKTIRDEFSFGHDLWTSQTDYVQPGEETVLKM